MAVRAGVPGRAHLQSAASKKKLTHLPQGKAAAKNAAALQVFQHAIGKAVAAPETYHLTFLRRALGKPHPRTTTPPASPPPNRGASKPNSTSRRSSPTLSPARMPARRRMGTTVRAPKYPQDHPPRQPRHLRPQQRQAKRRKSNPAQAQRLGLRKRGQRLLQLKGRGDRGLQTRGQQARSATTARDPQCGFALGSLNR
jgi:hypothetical protein